MKGTFFISIFMLSILFTQNFPKAKPVKVSDAKKAIVMGASSGIGLALAKELADRGYILGLASRRINLLESLAEELPGKSFIKQIDISDLLSARELFAELIEEMGGVDLVVINSGVWSEYDDGASGFVAQFKEMNWEKEQETINVNVSGFNAIANVTLNFFQNQGHGHLVGVSSVDAVHGVAGGPVYSSSKSFVSNYMQGVRSKFSQLGMPIYVTDIRPGYVSTYDVQPGAYWVATPEQAAVEIADAIKKKKKVAYVTKHWWIIGLLLQIVPDYIYDKIGGF